MSTDFLFLHGGGQGSWVWGETIEALRLQMGGSPGRFLTLDIAGCGTKRGYDTGAMTVSDIVVDLLADIEAAGVVGDAVLVGHSQAGTILPLLTGARPELFRHIVYVSCLAPTGGQTALDWRSGMPSAGESALRGDHPPGSRDRYRLMFCNDMTQMQAERFLDRLGPDRWPDASYAMSKWGYDHLAGLPATYVLCLRDATLIPAWQRIFAERLHVQEVVSVDAGHQIMNTRPHALAEILLLKAGFRPIPEFLDPSS
ncbi:MAG TPA: alpha/beta hydrolase [Sphingobium sp.]|uniref:alpha/beta fold hydrolase n=1 Tax=Sphingobium sp. TaxID=1912891 RepID=UPI002ED3C3FB